MGGRTPDAMTRGNVAHHLGAIYAWHNYTSNRLKTASMRLTMF